MQVRHKQDLALKNHNFIAIVNMKYECNTNSPYMSVVIQNASLSDINGIENGIKNDMLNMNYASSPHTRPGI